MIQGPKQSYIKEFTKKPLAIGSKAPEFSLKTTPDQKISLSDLSGKPIVLMFYPADFSPICTDEVALYNQILPEFDKHHAQVLGISVDNIWSHLAFARKLNLHFPLLSDFHPKGAVSKAYNAFREEEGESERAIYLINQYGNIAWGYISPVGLNPGAGGVLQALESLK